MNRYVVRVKGDVPPEPLWEELLEATGRDASRLKVLSSIGKNALVESTEVEINRLRTIFGDRLILEEQVFYRKCEDDASVAR